MEYYYFFSLVHYAGTVRVDNINSAVSEGFKLFSDVCFYKDGVLMCCWRKLIQCIWGKSQFGALISGYFRRVWF